MKFQWKKGARAPKGVDADTVGKRLDSIRKKAGLTASSVVADAASPSSPLHGCFVWDDTAAAREYRLHQARVLICAVVSIRHELPDKPAVRAFVHVTDDDDSDDNAYMSLDDALADPEVREQVINRAMAEASAWSDRHRHLSELADVHKAIARTKAKKGVRRKAA